MPSSKQALRWLAQSRDVWRAVLLAPVDYRHVSYTPRDGVVRYSYVRAYQVSLDEVEFTAVSVENGRVILRTLLTADPTRLRMNMGKEPTGVATRWVELGAEVGAREEGAPALTIDALYDQCEALLREDEVVPRLYFHAYGLLMSCGYPVLNSSARVRQVPKANQRWLFCFGVEVKRGVSTRVLPARERTSLGLHGAVDCVDAESVSQMEHQEPIETDVVKAVEAISSGVAQAAIESRRGFPSASKAHGAGLMRKREARAG